MASILLNRAPLRETIRWWNLRSGPSGSSLNPTSGLPRTGQIVGGFPVKTLGSSGMVRR